MRSFAYSPRDLLEALLRKEGIEEGYWELAVSFTGKGAVSSDDREAFPGPSLLLRVNEVRIIEKPDPTPATIDASKLKTSLKNK